MKKVFVALMVTAAIQGFSFIAAQLSSDEKVFSLVQETTKDVRKNISLIPNTVAPIGFSGRMVRRRYWISRLTALLLEFMV